jgi:hypothetical protein
MPTLAAKTKKAVMQAVAGELKAPPEVDARIKRGKESMSEGAPKRNECLRFARGRQYSWVDSQNTIREQETTSDYERRGGKARHRVRSIRNYIFDHVEVEVAGATQRVPGYDIAPTSTEPRRISAARLARKAIYYGYEQWSLDQAVERTVRYAVVANEGFAWPYFDNTVGPYFETDVLDDKGEPTGEKKTVGQGEIKVRVYGPNEVFFEPGLRFEESRWHAIEQARDIDSVMETDGYVGGKLDADAQKAETSDPDAAQDRLVLVTEYLERPTRKRPNGRWITLANNRVIIPERPYPCRDGEGRVLDEPVLHELHYAEDPDTGRNIGPVQFAIDPQRQLNHAVSKIAEWVNLMLNPQLIIQNGKILSGKLNDAPGAVVRIAGAGEIKVREIPPIPPELFRQKEEAILDMGRIFAQNDIPSQVESAKGIQFVLEKDSSRRATFYKNLAKFHARLARHCLYLVQRHYTEPRLLKIRGEQGIEPIADFLGAELLGEVDVRVSAGSLEPRTRESIEAKILAFADRGWVSPHEAMAAINSGTAEALVQSYEKDIARANLIIQKCKEGPQVLFNTPQRRPFFGEDPGIDEETMLPREFIPGWMPRPFDNIAVQKDVVADFMKGTEYDDFAPPEQEAINAVYDSFLQLEAKQQAEAAAAQAETAESLGMSNAARPTTPPPLPDQAPVNA